jgi:cell division protein ZapA
MKQIEVQIMGQSYLLASSEEGESLLRMAVGKVDTAMCQIRDAGKIKARDRIAVLAALNIAAQCIGAESKVDTQSTRSPQHNDTKSTTRLVDNSAQYDDLLARLDNALLDQ